MYNNIIYIMNQHKRYNNNSKFNNSKEVIFDLEKRFPSVELSYDKMDHTKVQYDMYMAIPYGTKVFAWFTFYKKDCVCVLVTKNRDGSITNTELVPCIFDTSLSYNTLFYGTIVNYDGIRFFCIEDIFYYKNKFVYKNKNVLKMQTLKYILENETKSECFTKNNIIFQLPFMTNNEPEMLSYIHNLPYKVYSLHQITLNRYGRSFKILPKEKSFSRIDGGFNSLKAVFKVKAEIQFDIYKLYCYNEGSSEHYLDYAYIPDCKTSVKMNSLFRRIKENDNLDYLEESDDEDDFENTDVDKYVDLDKYVYMECVYTPKFKRWIPTKQVNYNKLVCLSDVGNMIRNHYYVKNDENNRKYRSSKY